MSKILSVASLGCIWFFSFPVMASVTCSHSLENNPLKNDNDLEQHLSTISMVVSKAVLKEKADLANLIPGGHSLPGVAKLHTKGGEEIVRTGNYIFILGEDGSTFSFNQFAPGKRFRWNPCKQAGIH